MSRLSGSSIPSTSLSGDTSSSPMTLGSSIYESAAMSLFNAIKGDPDGTLRSLLAPSSLAPSQRHRALEELTGGRRDGVIGGILNVVTNPVVLVGAALAMKWPVLSPEGVAAAGSKLVEYGKWIPAPLRGLLGLNEIFYGTKIPRLLNRVAGESNAFVEDNFMRLNRALEEWRGVAGRTETVRDQIRWGLLSDPWWQTADGLKVFNAKIGELNDARKGMSLAPLAKLRPEQFASVAAEPGDEILVGALKESMNGVRTKLSGDLRRLNKLTEILGKQGITVGNAVKWAEGDYFPRIGTMDRDTLNQIKQDFVDQVFKDSARAQQTPKELLGRMAVNRTANISSASLAKRTGILPPDARDLRILGGIDENAIRSIEQLMAERAAKREVPAYTLRFSEAVRAYANRMGRAYAWSYVREAPEVETSLGEAVAREAKLVQDAEIAAGGSRAKTELLRSTYLPMAMGHGTFEQQMKALEWSGVRQAGWKIVESPTFAKVAGPELQQKFRDMMASSGWTGRTAGARIARYFYGTTLGLNLTSATQNLLQPLLTTAPIIGTEATLRGIVSVVSKIPEFSRLRSGGLTEREAIAKLWPAFSERAMESVGLFSEEALGESAQLAETNVMRPSTKFALDKFQSAIMQPFRISELFNRLTTFEGARIRGMMAGLHEGGAVDDFAQEVTNISQLWSGKQAAPSMMVNWNPALAQFMTFPSKLAGLFGASLVGIGGPFNPGTLGRAMMYSTVAYEMTKAVTGADISRGLLWGALPLPEADNDPFAPLPIVPPVLGIAGGVAMDIASGSGTWEHTRKNVPVLVPAGSQALRLSQLFTPEIARALGRSYVDRSQRLPDGRVPEFNADGQLIGARSEWSIAYDSMGIPGKLLEGGQKPDEQSMMQIVLSNRDRIRSMRGSFIEAVLDADEAKADAINRENLKLYGFPIQLRPEDFKAATQRRLLPRLDRVIKTMPKEYQPVFQIATLAATDDTPESTASDLTQYFQAYQDNQSRERYRIQKPVAPKQRYATVSF